jgi:hypothetical protein
MTPGSVILYRQTELQQPLSSETPLSRDGNDEEGLTSKNVGHPGVELNKQPNSVGQIIKVVNSVEQINNFEHFSSSAFPDNSTSLQKPADVPVQYVKVNLFRDHSSISNKLFLHQRELSYGCCFEWQIYMAKTCSALRI